MPVVTRIEVPPPEPFVEGEEGAEAEGAGYRFVAPRTATEPLVFQAADGIALFWTPTELVYGNGDGQLDFLAGSAPAEFTVRGRSVHYPRTFPASEEVHVALPEGRKYWLYLYGPPRQPAAHLSGDLWFGVSGMVGGIPLPSGRHQAMESFGFRFQPVYAEDTMGARVEGWYEVRDTDDGQQLFICIPADWLLAEDRVYPVKVDPTVIIASGVTLYGLFQMPKSGALLALVRLDSGLYAYVSTDAGQTWNPANTALGLGRLLANSSDRYVTGRPAVDNDDIIYVGVRVRDGAFSSCVLYSFRFDSANRTITQVSSYKFPDIVHDKVIEDIGVAGAAGANKTLYVVYRAWRIPGNTIYHYSYVASFNVTPDGAMSFSTEYQKFYRSSSAYNPDSGWYGCLSVSASGDVLIHYYDTLTGRFYISTFTGSPQEIAYGADMGIKGADVPCFLSGNYLMLADLTRINIGSGFGGAYGMAVYRAHDNKFVFAGVQSGRVMMKTYDRASGGFSDVVYSTFNVGSKVLLPLAPITTDHTPVLYSDPNDANHIMYDVVSFNVAPFAPTELACPNFDAADPVTFSWQFNDQNPGDRQSAYQLEIWLDGSPIYDTGWVSSPNSSHTLPSGTLQNGRSYQWRVRTKDQSGAESPWSDFAVVQTGPKPQATILHPTAGATVSTSEVTVEWSVANQSAATVRLYDGAGQTVLQEHEVTTPSARAKTITGLENNTSYQVSVQPVSSIGVVGDEVFSGPFSVQYTPPPKPTASAAEQAGFIRVTITNPAPTGDEPEVMHNDIYRREPGQGWVRIATGIAPDGTYDDYAVGSGVVYEYRARAVGANGTYTDSDVAQASVTITGGIWLHDPRDPVGTAHHFQYHELPSSDHPVIPSGTFQFAGRRYPVVQMDASQMERIVRYRLYLSDETDDRAALEALYERRTTLCLRNHRGKKYYVVFTEMPLEFERRGAWADVEFQVVDFDEEV